MKRNKQTVPPFTIERGIPLPPRVGQGRTRYPFASMKVGDSFAVPIGTPGTVQSAATLYGKRKGMRFASKRSATEIRIWRIA